MASSFLVEEEPHLTNEEGSFLKALQDRKNTSAELMIEPERTSSDKKDDNLSAFLSEQLDFNVKDDIISSLHDRLPYFLKTNLEDTESVLLPVIKFPFPSVQGGDVPLSHLKTTQGTLLNLTFTVQVTKIN